MERAKCSVARLFLTTLSIVQRLETHSPTARSASKFKNAQLHTWVKDDRHARGRGWRFERVKRGSARVRIHSVVPFSIFIPFPGVAKISLASTRRPARIFARLGFETKAVSRPARARRSVRCRDPRNVGESRVSSPPSSYDTRSKTAFLKMLSRVASQHRRPRWVWTRRARAPCPKFRTVGGLTQSVS